jgi:saccharopine dehydrogenase-like NADP-dependent oxidoreductase
MRWIKRFGIHHEKKFDVVLAFLPPECIRTVAEAAIKSRLNLVNTSYPYDILDLYHTAKEKGIAIIPECGLDPGIDLIIYNYSLNISTRYLSSIHIVAEFLKRRHAKIRSNTKIVAKLLEPQLGYKDSERDIVVMVNTIKGVREGKQQILTFSLLIERDLMTGLMAMSMGVAYPACITAEMIVRGDITRKGVLSPVTDVPCELFMDQLNKRGIKANKSIAQSK